MSIRFVGAVASAVVVAATAHLAVAAPDPAPPDPAKSTEVEKPGDTAKPDGPTTDAPPTTTDAKVEAKPAPAVTAPTAKRALPDYDGRGNYEADADHWALWIPRGILSPLYVVNEYVLRKPLGALVTVAERDRWLNAIAEIFTWGPNRQFMLIPTAVYDFGFRANVGLRFTADHFLVHNHDFTAHAAFGGTDWLVGSIRDRYRWNDNKTAIATHFDYIRRPDLIFMGLGPEVEDDDKTRYGLQKLIAGAWITHKDAGAQITFEAGVRHMGFREGECCDEPRLVDEIRAGRIEAPGYGTSYTVAYQSLLLALDTRPPRPEPGNGFRASLFTTAGFDPGHDRSWLKYGGSLGVAGDLTGRQRTLHLQLLTEFVDPMQGDEVPFTELSSMSDYNQMQGFTGGWMLGRSTIAAELGYTWPVAFMLDGKARVAVGNAFGPHLQGFDTEKLRLSADVGITTIGERDSGFELILGVGTSPFDRDDFGIDTVRIAVGSRRGI